MHDFAADRLEAGIVIERLAIARARQVDGERGAQSRGGPGRERDDAVGHVNALVGIVGDEENGFAVLLPDAGDFIL